MREPPRTIDLEPTEVRAGERLDSWKEIAAYLKRDISTVQRWEKREALPVYRHMHSERGTVYAYRAELDAWWNNRRPRIEAEEAREAELIGEAAAPEAKEPRKRWRRWAVFAAVVIVVAAGVGTAWRHGAALRSIPTVERWISAISRAPGVGIVPPSGIATHVWIPLGPDGGRPRPRTGMTAVFDDAQHRMIVFGGYHGEFFNEVWVLDQSGGQLARPEWMRLNPVGAAPEPRTQHSAVYDADSNRMMVFGGQNGVDWSNDLWVLTHANGIGGAPRWIELHPDGALPAVRSGHTAVYDKKSNRMILYGGLSAVPSVYYSDVWIVENANGLGGRPRWRRVSVRGSGPGDRHAHAAAYDPSSNRMIVYGGFTVPNWALPAGNQVWILTNANGLGGESEWFELPISGTPPDARARPSAAYDTRRNRLILAFGNKDTEWLNDVWALGNANGIGGPAEWTQIKTPGTRPEGRTYQATVYDVERDSLSVFGGQGIGRSFNDLWKLVDAGNLPEEVSDTFDSTKLDSAWQVDPGLGKLSLDENPGHLRFRAAATHPGLRPVSLFRSFRGETWTLETKVSYFTGPSGGGRSLWFILSFGSVPEPGDLPVNGVHIARSRDDWTGTQLGTMRQSIIEHGVSIPGESGNPIALNKAETYVWRIRRAGRTINVEVSEDNLAFREVARHSFGSHIDGLPQFLIIGGASFANFDSFADYDYVRLSKNQLAGSSSNR